MNKKFNILLFVSLSVSTASIGCDSSTNGLTCEMVSGRPYPEKGAIRYEGKFNVNGSGFEAILVVDGKEVDRVGLPLGNEQAITLKGTELASGEHAFELRTNKSQKPIAHGTVILP